MVHGMNNELYQQYVSDEVWELLKVHLPGGEDSIGGKARDNRLFINAVFWILNTGSPWRDLPPEYGDWKNTHRRFCRWRDKGIWEILLQQLIHLPGFEWLMIDMSHAKYLPCTVVGAKKSSHSGRFIKKKPETRYAWPWLRMICKSECLLQRMPRKVIRVLSHEQSKI